MYHCVFDKSVKDTGFQNIGSEIYKVSMHDFEQQLRMISDECKKEGKKVVFTFDDGGISFFNIIAPMLEKYGVKGIFFISTNYIDTEGFLTKKQIKELNKRGHIIASHSHTHPVDMSRLSNDEIFNEWKTSIDILSAIIGEKVEYASIPNGYSNKEILDAAHKNGIRYLYTSKPTISVSKFKEMVCIGRYAIQNSMSNEYVLSIISNEVIRKKIFLRWFVLETAKAVLGSSYAKIKNLLVKK
jgi:peptidoglycan/xylan/chitin deacetylase (PgdA/CDA1 family)